MAVTLFLGHPSISSHSHSPSLSFPHSGTRPEWLGEDGRENGDLKGRTGIRLGTVGRQVNVPILNPKFLPPSFLLLLIHLFLSSSSPESSPKRREFQRG